MVREHRDIDENIRQVKGNVLDAHVDQLRVTHPADDDGIWYFFMPGSERNIQIESSFGMCPFFIETDELSSQNARKAESVGAAVAMIIEFLQAPPDTIAGALRNRSSERNEE